MPEISIIIPTYNYAHFLPLAIDSILNQTYKNYEIIVVDDGSTDNTQQVIKKYLKKINYIRHKTNKGISEAMNTGIRAAKSKYINITQADDIMLPAFLNEEIKILKNGNAGIVYSPALIINENGETTNKQIIPKTKYANSYISLIVFNYIFLGTVLFKKDLLKNTGLFNTKMAQYEDWNLWLKISNTSNIGFVNKYLTAHRVHNKTLTHGIKWNFAKHARERLIVYHETIKNNIPEELDKWMFFLFLEKWITQFYFPPIIKKYLISASVVGSFLFARLWIILHKK